MQERDSNIKVTEHKYFQNPEWWEADSLTIHMG